MIEVRCKNCNKLLAMAELMNAAIKCNSCKQIFEYKIYSNLQMTNTQVSSEHIVVELKGEETMHNKELPKP